MEKINDIQKRLQTAAGPKAARLRILFRQEVNQSILRGFGGVHWTQTGPVTLCATAEIPALQFIEENDPREIETGILLQHAAGLVTLTFYNEQLLDSFLKRCDSEKVATTGWDSDLAWMPG